MTGDEGFELGNVLVTACLVDDEEAMYAAVHNFEEVVRDALVYLAQQLAHLWEQGCDDPLGEWQEALLIRAQHVYRDGAD